MCSKMERFIYVSRFARNILKKQGYEMGQEGELEFLKDSGNVKKEFYKNMQKTFGLKGEEVYLTENEQIPCLG